MSSCSYYNSRFNWAAPQFYETRQPINIYLLTKAQVSDHRPRSVEKSNSHNTLIRITLQFVLVSH
ncbi:hypothetical protein HanIR_Chr01g0024991 [Helianthus annuus]|nr:hypothetical protein HanIR_Chr01g0024991 [Helianthus annuus]